MRRAVVALTALVAVVVGLPAAGASRAQEERNGSVYARVDGDRVVLGNAGVERAWSRSPFLTTDLVDKRGADHAWSDAAARDFTLRIGGVDLGSDAFTVESVSVTSVRHGLRVTFGLRGAGLAVDRIVEAYNGVHGFRTQTVLRPTVALALSGATLDEAAAGTVAPTLHAFRAGADWREPDWAGPPVTVGDPHAGSWRSTTSAGPGEALSGPGQWITGADGARRVFLVMERNDQPSSRASYEGGVLAVGVDYRHDVIGLGPFEEQGHVENSQGTAGRARLLRPGQVLALEPAFTGLALDADDEAWQFHQYLVGRRLTPYAKAVTFNSNGTDADVISTGAKDDMNLATIQQVAPLARRLGVETFILDDGWQARSGDWYPDSPEHPEPRWDGDPGSKFAPRFPDATFAAVRQAIAPMKLGLWMSPMHFHPSSVTYQQHPEWVCHPVGDGTALVNQLDPESGSNEAGIGMWGPAAIPHVEGRIREAIEHWGVEYFKFDFLMWADCVDQGDLYDFREAFVAMLDRLRADHPEVTLQVDETNDYRLFPFESVARGPSWFQNGSPTVDRLLHNLWSLSPWVPSWSLGQHTLGGQAWRQQPVPTLMAAGLLSHITFFSDLRSFPADVIDEAAPWLAFYRDHRDAITGGVVHPLLADPLERTWTALQSWDHDKGGGALLVFRQRGADETVQVALRGVSGDGTFDLLEAPTGAVVGTVTAAELRAGLPVTLPPDGARVLVIVPK